MTLRKRTQVMGWGVALAVGGGWGVCCWAGDAVAGRWGVPCVGESTCPVLLGPLNIGSAWLVLAFVVGAQALTLGQGGWYGVTTLATAASLYAVAYQLDPLLASVRRFPEGGIVWGLVAVGAGVLMGAAGAAWQRQLPGWDIAAVALLACALVGEARIAVTLYPADTTAMGPGWRTLVIGSELMGGLLLPWLLLRTWRARWLGALPTLGLTSFFLG